VLLTDGTELKIVDGLDDHSRFCATARSANGMRQRLSA